MEGLLHYTFSWTVFIGICTMVLLTDIIDWVIDKWGSK
jgi:hypothetical protein